VDNDVYLYAEDNQLLFTRMLACLIREDPERMEADLNRDGMISTDEYFALLYRMLSSSGETDGIVLLALDAVYSQRRVLWMKRSRTSGYRTGSWPARWRS